MAGTSRSSSEYDDETRHHRPSFQSTRSHKSESLQPVAVENVGDVESKDRADKKTPVENDEPTQLPELVKSLTLTAPARAFPLASSRTSTRPPSSLRESRSDSELCTQAVSPTGSVVPQEGCSFEILGLSREEVSAILVAADENDPKTRVQSFAAAGSSSATAALQVPPLSVVPDLSEGACCPTCYTRLELERIQSLSAFAPQQQQPFQTNEPPNSSSSLPDPIPAKKIRYYEASLSDDDEDMIIAWEDHDPENPYNWSGRKKGWILLTCMMLIINSTMGSALPANALPFISVEWNVTSEFQQVLPISVYLIGYVMGPIVWAPLSEQFGRKRLTMATFIFFILFTLATALAPTWLAFLIFRLFTGVFASAPLALVPGIIADICSDPRTRGRNMGFFFMTTVSGPLLAPIISGFCAETIGWRWAFWIGLIYAGATILPLFFLPETFGPVLLKRRAQNIRRQDPKARVVALSELDEGKKSFTELTTIVLTRPIRMIIFEPIVNTSCAYLALCYAIFYMCFESFPFIFIGVYGLSPGECGLTYLAIGVGCLLALPIFFIYDSILRSATARNAPWTRQEEYRRLPLACIGGPMFVISLFWLGWTARKDVHFFVPMLAGVPFGIGFMCIFQALLNYLTDAYEVFAASANAAASCSRSLLATVLPLATLPMFEKLGISGACSLLGGISTLMCAIPFVFLWQGDKIRANSKFCIALRERKEKNAKMVDEQRRKSAMKLEMQRQGKMAESQRTASSGSGMSSGAIIGPPDSGAVPQERRMETTVGEKLDVFVQEKVASGEKLDV
ncbi:putative polyamine transporter [Podospora australis]|uniref:Polyamine transporter n=1 Tax=Podospora australis TaxID=1536484 RepID=A0AAN7AFJ1_9PEZI|nr:putative polyamine transporter [Podospora australis]